jgi:hypothetical protein
LQKKVGRRVFLMDEEEILISGDETERYPRLRVVVAL